MARSGVGCEVKDLGEDDVAVVFGCIVAVVHGTVQVEGKYRRRLGAGKESLVENRM